VDELKRLQTFPDDYEIVGTRRIAYKQIGNAVPPQFARILAIAVLDQFFHVKLPFNFHYLEEHEKLSFRKLKNRKSLQYFEQASLAVNNLKGNPIKALPPKTYRIKLAKNFKLSNSIKSKVKVEFIPTADEWIFRLLHADGGDDLYKISIRKNKHIPLFLSVREVHLFSNSNQPSDYTILWKVFEKALFENNIKADLVQLNGYYQYSNNISYTFITIGESLEQPVWKYLDKIFSDPGIGQIANIQKMAERYGVKQSEMMEYLSALREIGYEIRNSHTNPEIPDNCYLIPYKFPTLTPLSVQLRKSLSPNT
jgi:DNA (cytosine-5)-methyltransferase 1